MIVKVGADDCCNCTGGGPPVTCGSTVVVPFRINFKIEGYPTINDPITGEFFAAPNGMPTAFADTQADLFANPINLLENKTYSLKYYAALSYWGEDGVYFDPLANSGIGGYRDPVVATVPGDGVLVDYWEMGRTFNVACPTLGDPPGSGTAGSMLFSVGSFLWEYRVGISTPSNPFNIYTSGLIFKNAGDPSGDWDTGLQSIQPFPSAVDVNSGWLAGGNPPKAFNISGASYNQYQWLDYDSGSVATGAKVTISW